MSTLSEKKEATASIRREILHIGVVGRAHGLNGEVHVRVLSSDPNRLDHMAECLLTTPDEKGWRLVRIEQARKAQGHIVVKIEGVDDRSAAESLRGSFLSVKRNDALTLQENEWFVCDLVGCEVFDSREGALGTVLDVMQNGSQDVYVVRTKGQPDLLFPARKSILRRVDVAARQIDVDLPDGLYEVYRGRKS